MCIVPMHIKLPEIYTLATSAFEALMLLCYYSNVACFTLSLFLYLSIFLLSQIRFSFSLLFALFSKGNDNWMKEEEGEEEHCAYIISF